MAKRFALLDSRSLRARRRWFWSRPLIEVLGMDQRLTAFSETLASHGLAPEGLDPWRGWIAFKEYARSIHEFPDPGVSVQLTRLDESHELRLAFVRQVLRVEEERLAPVGAVVCELTFPWPRPASARRTPVEWDRWSFEHANFERFVDVVEGEPDFQDLIVTRPVRSSVYWEDCGHDSMRA